MVGYPWETKKDAEETINFAREMFRKGYLDTLQATIVVPYPGTPMFEEAKRMVGFSLRIGTGTTCVNPYGEVP